ncbi:hypothetical protein LR003_00310 [candidate division NPL-UPA2 bacterium]|nr:hypothetical protein [candidate division NPL-UPA2 bacterium]
MGKLKKTGKVIGLIAVAILLIGAVVHTGLNYFPTRALERELEALRDAGIPLTLAEIALPLIPDEENAAIIYQKAFDLLQEGDKEEKEAFGVFLTEKGRDRINWPEINVSLIRSLLEKNAGALSLVRQATRLEKSRFPLEYEKGLMMALPYLAKMRRLARLLAAQALLQSEEGKVDEALKTLSVGLRLGRSLETEPSIISQLVRMAINTIMLQAMEIILNQHEAQPATYKALIRELDDLKGRIAFTRSLEGERAFGLWTFDMMRQEPELLLGLEGRWAWLYVYGSYLLRPILKRDQVYYLRMAGRLVALSRLPYYQAVAEVRDFEKELEHAVPRYGFITRALLPPLSRTFIRQARSEAQIRAGKLALALRIYRARQGTYPETLKALTPEILSQLPVDPFTGKDYIYRREEEGFIVYSVGENLRDDQGTFDPGYPEEGDIIWRSQR